MIARRALLLVVLSVVSAATAQDARVDPDPNRFAAEIKAFAEWDSKNAVPVEPVLFAGSSTARMWRTHESFPDLPVVNRGFGGSHISDVIHYAGQVVLPYKPQVIVFYAGDNDIAGGKSAERVAEDYRKFVALVHAQLPAVRIVFLSIKPSGQRWSLWPEASKANKLIEDFCKQNKRLFFADLTAPLLDGAGKPKPELFLADQLHLNSDGYAVWSQALRPILAQALATRP
ncbi:MAG: GDSL-type esterase/lipase family protein [Solirubrobacterales bacterium]